MWTVASDVYQDMQRDLQPAGWALHTSLRTNGPGHCQWHGDRRDAAYALLNFGVFNRPWKNSNFTQFFRDFGVDTTFTTPSPRPGLVRPGRQRESLTRTRSPAWPRASACHLAFTPECCSRRQSKLENLLTAKSIPKPRVLGRGAALGYHDSGFASLTQVGRASAYTGRSRVGGGSCGQRPARLTKMCYLTCDSDNQLSDSVQESKRFSCSRRAGTLCSHIAILCGTQPSEYWHALFCIAVLSIIFLSQILLWQSFKFSHEQLTSTVLNTWSRALFYYLPTCADLSHLQYL